MNLSRVPVGIGLASLMGEAKDIFPRSYSASVA